MRRNPIRDRLQAHLSDAGYAPLSLLDPSEMKALAERWLSTFAANVRKAKGVDVFRGYRWHGFSYQIEPHVAGSDAVARYMKNTGPFIVFDEDNDFALRCEGNRTMPPDLSPFGEDLYVCDFDCTWTMAFTHEQPELGPYFSARKAVRDDGEWRTPRS